MSIINYEFAGLFVDQIVGSGGLVTPGAIHRDDPFAGTFSFDSSAAPIATSPTSATYETNSFTVTLPNSMQLGASQTSLTLSTDPQDPSIQVYGELPCNLFMGLLLRGPSGIISDTSPPGHIEFSNFIIKHFTVSDTKAALFGYSQTPAPPPGTQVFLRGELKSLKRLGTPSIIIGLLRAKYSIHRHRA
jgi:hypothetical protein